MLMGPGVRRGDWSLSFEVEQFPRTVAANAATLHNIPSRRAKRRRDATNQALR